MQRLLLLAFALISVTSLYSQDHLFSQFYASPMTLNPALTGAFDGKFRVSSIYRTQWNKSLDNPFNTFSTSLDLRFPLGRQGTYHPDVAAAGLVFYKDEVGEIDFSTTQISIFGAFHKSLGQRNTQYLSLGLEASIGQRNVNYANITFDDQFNGISGFTDPTAEILPENNFSFSDLSVGLNYTYTPQHRTGIFAGFAIHHFLEPSVSFFKKTNQDDENVPENTLLIKYSGQLSFRFPLTQKIQLLPRAIFSKQGPYLKIDSGSNFRFTIDEINSVALHIGTNLRSVTNENSRLTVSDVVGLLGIEYKSVLLGFSYDFNLDALSISQPRQGAFEISIAYLGKTSDDLILCPTF